MSEKQKRGHLIKRMWGGKKDDWILITWGELREGFKELLEEFKSSRKRGRPKKK